MSICADGADLWLVVGYERRSGRVQFQSVAKDLARGAITDQNAGQIDFFAAILGDKLFTCRTKISKVAEAQIERGTFEEMKISTKQGRVRRRFQTRDDLSDLIKEHGDDLFEAAAHFQFHLINL